MRPKTMPQRGWSQWKGGHGAERRLSERCRGRQAAFLLFSQVMSFLAVEFFASFPSCRIPPSARVGTPSIPLPQITTKKKNPCGGTAESGRRTDQNDKTDCRMSRMQSSPHSPPSHPCAIGCRSSHCCLFVARCRHQQSLVPTFPGSRVQ